MPRILTKTSQDEILCTPKRKLTQSSRKGNSSSTRKRTSKAMIPTAYHLKSLVIEVNGDVLNDDNGLFRSAISKGDFDLAELLLQLQSVVDKLEEIHGNPTDFDLSARRVRTKLSPSDAPQMQAVSPVAKRSGNTSKPLATPYRGVLHDSESDTSPRMSSTPRRKSATRTDFLVSRGEEAASDASAVGNATPIKIDETVVDESVSPDHATVRLSKSPTFFERVRNKISFGFTSQ